MKPDNNNSTGTAWEGPGDRAREIMREYRGLLGGHAAVPDLDKKSGKKTRTSAKPKAPAVADLPSEMRQLLDRYKREHPKAGFQLVAYLTAGGPDATRNAPGIAELPPEDDMVVLALTQTIASAERVEARSQVLLLRRVGKR